MKLKSVSNPIEDETLESAVVAVRKVREGTKGEDPEPANVRSTNLLAVGKGEPVMRPAPPAGVSALESVIGSDDRTRILDTDASPWRMICALRIKAPAGQFIGTAWFAGPKTLITAGHCVYDAIQMDGWPKQIEVVPGRDGNEMPFGKIKAKRYSTVDRWTEARDPDFDIGAIHLDKPIGKKVGWFAVGSLPPDELIDYHVNISGYPLMPGQGRQQWFHENRILKVTDRRIFYDVDTYGGQSGAPVWIHESKGSPPLVVGIHAYGIGGTPTGFQIAANSAPRIIPEVFDQIAAWVEADGE